MKLLWFIIFSLFFPASSLSDAQDLYIQKRMAMVEKDIRGRGVRDPKVLAVMGKVPRHLFVDEYLRDKAYADHPLPIGEGQTISQPYVVALMTEALRLKPTKFHSRPGGICWGCRPMQ